MTQTFRPAGHLIQRHPSQEPEGEPGTGYDYIMAGNGIFGRARGPHIQGTALVAPAEVRGLAPMEPGLTLPHGPIPSALLQALLRAMRLAAPSELMAAITLEPGQEYQLRYPPQSTGPAHVEYEALPHTVLEIHSHADGSARFSHIDDHDEQGLAVYGVVGTISTRPSVSLRLGVYGYFQTVPVRSVFAPQPQE